MYDTVMGGLRFKSMSGYACYSGSTTALLAAGHLLPGQVPGVNGNPATCASFHADGSRVQRGEPNAHKSLGYLKVQRLRGNRLLVKRCVEEIAATPASAPQRQPQTMARHFEHWPFPQVFGTPPSITSGAGARLPRQAPRVRAGHERRERAEAAA